MNLDFKYIGDNLLVRLSGDIDEYSARVLRGEVDRLIEASRLKCLTMDMSRVTFIDSTGLGFVLGRYKKLKACRAELVLQNVPPQVDRVFATSGVYSLVPKID